MNDFFEVTIHIQRMQLAYCYFSGSQIKHLLFRLVTHIANFVIL